MREEDDQLYIYKLYGIALPRFIKSDKALRARIGPNTKITDDQIKQAQDIIDNTPIDFEPYAMNYLHKIKEAVEMAAAMFGNHLASEISAMILKFIEHYKRLDSDMLVLLEAYCKTIHLSYSKKLYNVDTPGGRVLLSEMGYAMERYAERFRKKTGR